MECSICCEKFNKSTHLKVKCKGCPDEKEHACRKCCQTYILTSQDLPKCMFCKSSWDREFLNLNLTKRFVDNDLKKHCENIYLEKQIALLPGTQHAAAIEKEIRKFKTSINQAEAIFNKYRNKCSEQAEIIKAYRVKIHRLEAGIDISVEDKNENFTLKCPNQQCKGFLNNKYTCSLCEMKYCKHCLELKDENHVCDEEVKNTVSAIIKDSKSCPGCGERISKIDGCDQMWCIKCHIQFSWKTGNILNGYNHNPEYFRWLRETNQNIDRNPLDERGIAERGGCTDPISRNIQDKLRDIFYGQSNQKIILEKYLKIVMLHRHSTYRHETGNQNRSSEILLKKNRVGYLLGDITKENWKLSIQRLYKKDKKEEAYNNIWGLLSNVLRSYIDIILDKIKTAYSAINPTVKDERELEKYIYFDIKEIRKDIIKVTNLAEDFRHYINTSFLQTADTFNSNSCPGIDENFREIYNYKDFLKRKKS